MGCWDPLAGELPVLRHKPTLIGPVLWLMAGLLLFLVVGVSLWPTHRVWPLTGRPLLAPEGPPASVEEGLDLLQ